MTTTDESTPAGTRTIDIDALKEKYAAERDKRLRPDGNDQYLRAEGPARSLPRRPVHAGHRARAVARPRHGRVHRRRVRGPRHGRPPEGSRDRRRAHHREGRRLRRHLVLEPLSGRAVRHRVVRLHAAARRDRAHADREVRARARDPRALPPHRQAVRPLRQRAVPHRGHRPRVGRRALPVDRPHEPRRRVHRAVRRDGHRPAARAQAAGHSRASSRSAVTRSTRAGGTTTTRAAIRRARRWTSWPTSASPSSAPARRRCSASRTSRAPASELYVFQRTPSSVDVRDNRPTDPEWFAEIATPGWQQRWLENFTANQTGGDGRRRPRAWTAGPTSRAAFASRIMALPPEEFTPEKMMAAFEDYDFEKMEEIRARVDAIVEDPTTAQNLKAWYRQLCKRPCFHDEYLQAYNEPGHAPRRHRRQGRRAHHRERRGRRGRRVRGRLHHLRVGLRGRHAAHARAPAST